MKALWLFLFSFSIAFSALAQKGTVRGILSDKKGNAPIIGATIHTKDNSAGTASGGDGSFSVVLSSGTHILVVEAFGYVTKELPEVTIVGDTVIVLNIQLDMEESEMKEVVVVGQKDGIVRESAESMIAFQKKTVSNVSTISSEDMKKLPDRSSGEVLRRVSGTTVQDGKYVTIRGLSDRYNLAMINGVIAPSTETDRKAFSFDVIPANLLDNIIIYKTATPDLPADFAGGIVQVTTKDIPDERRSSLSGSLGLNELTTFKNFYIENGSKTDFLGFDNKFRRLPNGIPANNEEAGALTPAQGAEQTKLWHHDFSSRKVSSMAPSYNLTYSFANRYKIFKNPFGILLGVNYNNSPSYMQSINNSLRKISSSSSISDEGVYSHSSTYGIETLGGVILNLSYRPAPWISLGVKNTISSNSSRFVSDRNSKRIDDPTADAILIRENALFFSSNQMYSTQGNIDIILNKNITWKNKFGYNKIDRKIPDYRKTIYRSTSSEDEDGNVEQSPYNLYTSSSPNFAYNTGRYFQFMKESNYSVSSDLTFIVLKNKLKMRAGALYLNRGRNTDIRTFAYTWRVQYQPGDLPIDQILIDENFTARKIRLLEMESNYYDVVAKTFASYGMLDFSVTERVKLIGGVRYENYNQSLSSVNVVPFTETKDFNSFLPSAIGIYNLTDKMNLKLSYSKTVSRPEFREIAPVQFYDYLRNLITSGNPQLTPAKIDNYDIKWEYFFKPGQFVAINPFYKTFKNPIETRLVPSEAPLLTYANIEKARALGVEFEFRYALLKNLFLNGNLALIQSRINQNNSDNDFRVMQGQSPYVINTSIQYVSDKYHFNTSFTLNRIGTRIEMDGLYKEQILYEKGRTMIDFQLTKELTKRITVQYILGNLLSQDLIYFYDINNNQKFDDKDIQFNNFKMARRHSVSFTFNL